MSVERAPVRGTFTLSDAEGNVWPAITVDESDERVRNGWWRGLRIGLIYGWFVGSIAAYVGIRYADRLFGG